MSKNTKRGQVWMCDFRKNVGSEQNGVRPCLILNFSHKQENTCIVVPSSKTLRPQTISVGSFQFLAHQIRAVDTTRLIRLVQRLPEENTDQVALKVGEYIKVPPEANSGGQTAFQQVEPDTSTLVN